MSSSKRRSRWMSIPKPSEKRVVIEAAITSGKGLLVEYRDLPASNYTQRVILPSSIKVESGGEEVLVTAFCTLRSEFRSFYLSRLNVVGVVEVE